MQFECSFMNYVVLGLSPVIIKNIFIFIKKYFYIFFSLLHSDWRTTMKIRLFTCFVLSFAILFFFLLIFGFFVFYGKLKLTYLNWLNWFHVLILEADLFVILIDCMIFLSPFLNVIRMSMLIAPFLAQLDCGILCLWNAFLWPMI